MGSMKKATRRKCGKPKLGIPAEFAVKVVHYTDNGYDEFSIMDRKTYSDGKVVWRGRVRIDGKKVGK